MRRWLDRLAFSFVILAAVLIWTVYRGRQQGTLSITLTMLYLLLAAACLILAGIGIRYRHRTP